MIRSTELGRRAQQGSGLGAGVDKALRKEVYKRDGYRCALCDDHRRLQLHHVVPRGEGGPDTQMNLITLCPRCHALAHGTDIDRLGLRPQDVYQSCVEYLSDVYASEGIVPWNPWNPIVVHFRF